MCLLPQWTRPPLRRWRGSALPSSCPGTRSLRLCEFFVALFVFMFVLYLYFYCICICTCISIKKCNQQVVLFTRHNEISELISCDFFVLCILLRIFVFVLALAFVFEFVFVFVYTFVQPASTLPRCQLAHSPPPIGQTNNQLCCTCWEPDQPNFRPHPCFTCGFVWIVSFFEFELEELPNSVLTRRTRIVGAQWKTDVLTLFVYVFVFTLVFVLTHRTRCVRNLRQHVAPAAIYAAA